MTLQPCRLASRIESGKARVAFTFAGQAGDYFTQLRQEALAHPEVMALVARVEARLAKASRQADAIESGLLERPLLLTRWVRQGDQPGDTFLMSSVVSQPLIFLTQAARLRAGDLQGFAARSWPHLAAVAGHSQGMMTALLVSMGLHGEAFDAEVERICLYFFWQGIRMQQAWNRDGSGRRALQAHYERFDEGYPSPMAAVRGLDRTALESLVARQNDRPDSGPVVISLINTRDRFVLSGAPADLATLRLALADRPLKWEFLRTSAPFHSPYMAPALARFREDLRRLDITVDAGRLQAPVLLTSTGENLQERPDLTEALLQAQYLQGVDWQGICRRLVDDYQVTTVVDWGPQRAVSQLTAENLEGMGIACLSVDDPDHREPLFSREAEVVHPPRWADFAPRTVELPDGSRRLHNRYTALTGFQPLFGGAMTPTTATPEIVAAAAHAGCLVELAGGGQVTEALLRQRFDALRETLPPGTGFVFNVLYLDPWLWKLQRPLLVQLRHEGYPLVGVTISGGVPPVEEATALFTELFRAGIRINSVKAGSPDEIKRALAIADALGDLPLIVQVEGGHAGGHHSRTPLPDLLDGFYAALRSRSNVLVAAGGGVATPAEVDALLQGTWAHGPAPRPVDAVFVGTALMACAEAFTSAPVKARLAEARGSDRILPYGRAEGDVLSGRSGLDADVYYLDNAAARAALELEELAALPREKEARLSETQRAARHRRMAELLDRTCKPWFGDLHAMTWREVLERLVALMAPGNIPASLQPFGPWYDESYHDRFVSLATRLLERFAPGRDLPPTPDTPGDYLARVCDAAGPGAGSRLLDEDVDLFLWLCDRPGKPVNFVPALDGEVARRLKQDCLWQAHDPRYGADAVFVLPGPSAVRAIERVDEPVAETLSRLLAGSFREDSVEPLPYAAAPTSGARPRMLSATLPAGHPRAVAAVDAALTAATIHYEGALHENFIAAWPQRADRLTWRPTDEGVTLTAHAYGEKLWSLHSDGERLEVAIPLGARAGSLHLTARFRPDLPTPLLFDPVAEPVTEAYARVWDSGLAFDIDAFRAIVQGDEGHAPPICAAFPMAWNTITRTLFAELPPLNYLKLLHLGQELFRDRRLGERAPDKVEAGLEAVEETADGVVATVVGVTPLGLWSRSRFLIRGAHLPEGFVLPDGGTPVHWPVPALPEDPEEERVVVVDRRRFQAPASAEAYARCSGDSNPLHLSPEVASMAGYPGPIMHGMWTLARALSLAIDHLGESYGRLSYSDGRFLAPVRPGEELTWELARLGAARGGRWFLCTVRAEDRVALEARIFVRPRRTAYLFTGQGSQFPGMGMDLYARSPAARAVWDQAEKHLKSRFGFSILEVVRNNPTFVRFSGRRLTHPEGVLNLTQFTQISLVLVELAQVAHLQERGRYVDRAMFAGHSLGEFAALAALGVLPLERTVDLVYRRGLTMQELVQRDRHGKTPFGMAVVRPNRAGLTEAGLRELVAGLRETGLLEVVNFNVRDQQYSVCGERSRLAALRTRLEELCSGDGPAPYVPLPGIDVPFHSTHLRPGVDAFRRAIREAVGETVEPRGLEGRYVPNLVGRPFRLIPEFVQAALDACGSPALAALLQRWDEVQAEPERLAATLLVELLSYQFASPVRWVETQEVLLDDPAWSVDDLVEIGPQPVLKLMALRTLAARPPALQAPRILHVEADSGVLVESDQGLPEEERDTPAAETAPPPTPAEAATATAAPTAPEGGPGLESWRVDTLALVRALLAAKRQGSLPSPEATIEGLCEGNSARRNEFLADLAAEFECGGLAGNQTLPLAELALRIDEKLPAGWLPPGPFTTRTLDQRLPVQLGMRLEECRDFCTATLGLTRGQAGSFLALLPAALAAGENPGRANATSWLTALLDTHLAEAGITRTTATRDAGEAKVSLDAVREELLGRGSAFRKAVEALARASGLDLDGATDAGQAPVVPHPVVNEVMEQAAKLLEPRFDEKKIVEFDEPRNWMVRDLLRVAMGEAEADRAFRRRCASFRGDEAVEELLAWLRPRHGDRLGWLDEPVPPSSLGAVVEALKAMSPLPGAYVLRPEPDLGVRFALDREATAALYGDGGTEGTGRHYETVLVTGAGPGSIGEAFVRELLESGRNVVVTASTLSDARTRHWRKLYARHGARGSRLVVVPANQGSRTDLERVVDTCFGLGLVPGLCLPFGAISQVGPTGDADPGITFAAHRIMLDGVEALLSAFARKSRSEHYPDPVDFILPLSPNHGQFGGDGIYAELKLGLEALLFKARTEPALAERTRVAGLSIGWTRGTGLMAAHDDVSAALERTHGLRTFSPEEMAGLTLDLLPRIQEAWTQPTILAIHGGLERVGNIGTVVAELRAAEAPPAPEAPKTSRCNPLRVAAGLEATWTPAAGDPNPGRRPTLSPEEAIAIVGFGEVSPLGNSVTRWELEAGGVLSLEGAVEMAWLMGLIEYRADRETVGFVDAESGRPVADWEVKARYEERILAHTGIRFLEPEHLGVASDRVPVFANVLLEEPFDVPVPDRENARAFLSLNPDAQVVEGDGGMRVRLPAGSVVRVPRALRLDRYVAGQVPSGWSPQRFGIPSRVAEQVDRVTLFNLVASAEAFLMAGLTPEELKRYVHPTLIGNTQGSGLGGMQSLARLYHDYREEREGSSDVLQETLINVMGGWLVQDYVGSFGPTVHPVGACATAAVSLATAWDLLRVGKARFVVAGGFDDLGVEANLGFARMQATAATDEMLARGIGPGAMSRPNDARREGFVESQGGATLLVTTVAEAVKMGLPIYGCLALAQTHNDGLQSSIPAPGRGLLAIGMGLDGAPSPLEKALADWGLGVDDIRVVSKHDTSTRANDPNEARLVHDLMRHLGREVGNPLLVHSQKSVLGHAKGGAAGWQAVAALQMLRTGRVPGNPNLDNVDADIGALEPLVMSDETVLLDHIPAVLALSLGFGHVGAALLLVHPDRALALLDDDARTAYRSRLAAREWTFRKGWLGRLTGHRPAYGSRTGGPQADDLLRGSRP